MGGERLAPYDGLGHISKTSNGYSGEVIEDEFGTVPVEQDMPFDPERDMLNGSEAAQERREFAGEVRAEEKAKVARLLTTDFDKQERLREFIEHQMKFFDVSGSQFEDVQSFNVSSEGRIFEYQVSCNLGESASVRIELVGPGKYKINGKSITLNEILEKLYEITNIQNTSDENLYSVRDGIITVITESLL